VEHAPRHRLFPLISSPPSASKPFVAASTELHRSTALPTPPLPSPPNIRRARAPTQPAPPPHPLLARSVVAAEPSAATAGASPFPDLLPRRLSTAGEHTSPLLSVSSFHFASSRTPRSPNRCQFWPAMAALSAGHGIQKRIVTCIVKIRYDCFTFWSPWNP
jgi:hypothetical protein